MKHMLRGFMLNLCNSSSYRYSRRLHFWKTLIQVRVQTHPSGTSIVWEFATDDYDIGFGLFFEWAGPLSDPEVKHNNHTAPVNAEGKCWKGVTWTTLSINLSIDWILIINTVCLLQTTIKRQNQYSLIHY